ncbi:MAG: VWA domain-containing protein [Acidobacteria bacterium]|nr:VWA domain-containing protein [Acidobacteriota bacterium]
MKRSLSFSVGLAILLGLVPAVPLQAEKRISLAQLEQIVAQLKSAVDPDAAQRLAEVQLTERLNGERYSSLAKSLPGDQSRHVLRAVADRSQFVHPPASEIPSNPVPSMAEQRRIMGMVAAYVRDSIPQLPNFFATRITDHFEDSPQLPRGDMFSTPYQPIHFVSQSQVAVFYQGGREVVDSKARSGRSRPLSEGLTSWGTFGPILGTVLVDAASSKLAWSHWEAGTKGPVAIFDFDVPQQKSHYEVNYCCYVTQAGSSVADGHPFRRIVPYRGSMGVDPATGVIERLIVEAELKATDPVTEASILVDYGPVEIGGKTYTCPVRSISTTIAESVQVDPKYKFAIANALQPLKTSLNDVTFENYHMFRSDVRVLTPEEADLVEQVKAGQPAVASAAERTTTEVAPEGQPAAAISEAKTQSSPEASGTPLEPRTDSATASTANTPAPSSAKPVEPAPAEITTTAAASLPDVSNASTASATDTGYRLRTTTRMVEVTVVAFDKKGHPVTDLKPEDFEVYDNGRKQNISSLTQAAAETPSQSAAGQSAASSSEPTFSNRPVDTSSAPASGPQRVSSNTTIFLIDSSHVAFADLTHARSEMLRFLKTVPADEPVALYVLKKYGFEVLREPTTDHEQLSAVLRKWMPSAQDLSQAANEEMRNRQQMEYVHSANDLLAMNGNTPTGAGDVTSAPDMQRRSLGDSPELNALGYVIWVARHAAAFKGHKSLIWVATDNVLADFSDKSPDVEKGDKYLDPLSIRAREALNDAQISIYPLDSSQLEGGVVGADLQHANVQVNPTATDMQLQGTPGASATEASQQLRRAQRDINPGRLTAQLQQDTHPIQGAFRELAEATGGRTLRRASDIAAELDSIVNDGRAAYTLGFSPDTPADGTYHHLVVKPINRRGITLRYRTGYLYEKEPATLKERFQNAVWRPADQSEIGLSAKPTHDAKPASLKLNIAATDLALAEQAGFWMDKLDIFLVQRDDAMLHAKLDGQTLGLRLKPSTYQQVLKDGISIDEPIKSVPENGALRIVVVDENTGRIGTLTLPASALSHK